MPECCYYCGFMKPRKRIGKILTYLSLPILLVVVFLTPVDKEPYGESDFYASTMDRLDSLQEVLASQSGGALNIGWGKANITPPQPVRLTGKNWTPYQEVFDSAYVRSLLIGNGPLKIAIVSFDLWILHPHLAGKLSEAIKEEYSEINGLYFTANHSHTSIGGWGQGLLGSLIMGGNNASTVGFIVQQTLKSIQQAQANQSAATIAYGEIETEGLVMNRLDSLGTLDAKLRFFKATQDNGTQAVFSTYSAHSVYMNKDINTLSADYPGVFLPKVEGIDGIDFASFAPGATGSHTPIGRKPFSREKMDNYGEKLKDYLAEGLSTADVDSTDILKFVEWPIDMRSPHFRISNHWRVRPWLFQAFMGKPSPSITALRIGNTVMVGLPVELSGEYYDQFKNITQTRDINLIITTFNGNYLGYVNPYKYYYTLRRSETRDMNWYGPQAGEYYVELINELLAII